MSVQVTVEESVIRVIPSVDADESILVVEQVQTPLEVGIIGPQGPEGPQGATGPEGPQGLPGASAASYRHVQNVPASVWTVEHNLNGYLNITVIDSSGKRVFGDVVYISVNVIELRFSAAFSGEAYVS